MLPPMLLRVRVQGDKRRIRLWIPAHSAMAGHCRRGAAGDSCSSTSSGALGASRSESLYVLLAGPLLLYVLASLRGLRFDVASGEDRVFISID